MKGDPEPLPVIEKDVPTQRKEQTRKRLTRSSMAVGWRYIKVGSEVLTFTGRGEGSKINIACSVLPANNKEQ